MLNEPPGLSTRGTHGHYHPSSYPPASGIYCGFLWPGHSCVRARGHSGEHRCGCGAEPPDPLDPGEPHHYCVEHKADEWGGGSEVCLRVGGSILPHTPCRWRRVYVVVAEEKA